MRLNSERLTGIQINEFRNALRDAFDGEQEFKEFLLTQLDRRLNDFTSKDTFPTEIFNIIEAADTGDWTEELLRAARLWRPTNMKLLMFAEQFGLTPSTPPNTNLKSVFERMVRPNNKVVDVAVWRNKLEQIEGQICRVEVRDGGETTFGTGFLLGPDVVMTNYHVVKDVIKRDISPKDVSFLFDFKKTIDASLAGIPYHLAEQDWYIDCSEPDSLDEFNNPWDRAADENKLDYALMRLSTRIGEERIGGKANKNPGALPRGWIEVPTTGSKLLRDREVFILQHKDGDELTLALDTHSIIRTNLNNTRVFYKTNTDEGSSGAPCFDIDWQLVALHQGGDTANKPEYNQGIPFTAILKRLEKQGKRKFLGSQQPIDRNIITENAAALEGNSSTSQSLYESKPANDVPSSTPPLQTDISELITNNQNAIYKNDALVDRKDLLDKLCACPAGIFSKIVVYCDLPDGVLSSERTSQNERASELIKWAEQSDDLNLNDLNNYYLRAKEGRKKKS